MADWQKLGTKIVYKNQWITLYEDDVIDPAGNKTIYSHIAPTSDAVCVVALDENNNTYIVKLRRYVTGTTAWECPAGKIDGDSIENAAKRELLEETGVRADTIEIIGKIEVFSGTTSFRVSCCIASGLTKVSENLDQLDGIIEAKMLPLEEVCNMILKGDIVCSESITAFLMASKFIENKTKGQ